MANALFSYHDIAAAQRAAQRLAAMLPPQSVVLHAKNAPANDTLLDQADEAVSGGLFRNVFDLFQGVFEWGDSPHEASDYEETVRKGGAVVSVDARTAAEQAAVDQAMQGTGFAQRTDWRTPESVG